jgi:hypothetical protein
MRILITVTSDPRSAEVEDEYNDWYDNVHLDELRSVPGTVYARRFRRAAAQMTPQAEGTHGYITVVERDVDDVESAITEMKARTSRGFGSGPQLMDRDRPPIVTIWEPL